jgi:hypothetical protein
VSYPETRTDSVVVEDTLSALSGNVTTGFVFSFNDNFTLDFLAGVYLFGSSANFDTAGDPFGHSSNRNEGNSGFNINLTTVKILFTFKF